MLFLLMRLEIFYLIKIYVSNNKDLNLLLKKLKKRLLASLT